MPGKDQPRRFKTFLLFATIAVLTFGMVALIASTRPAGSAKVQDLQFSAFLDKLAAGEVEAVRINPTSHTLVGVYQGKRQQQFRTAYPDDYQITNRLELEKVAFDVERTQSSSASWLILLGVIGFIVVLILLNRSRQTAAKAGAGSPGRMVEAGEVAVSFRDVAGCDEVVEELSEIKSFLSDPERFRQIGANIPKGVLLFGPPGTGKTLLARAVAGEAGVPFFSISGSDFVEMYVGVGASRVRKLFEAAKAAAPCVVFIDEIDAVGRRRSGAAQGGQEERENTLNQLLVEMDGFAPTDNVIVMAASNRADILDPALTRPGRFDRQVIVDSPDRKGRLEILKVHGKGKPWAGEIDLGTVAAQTAGFCGADLANLVNEAALLAARNDRQEITSHDLDEAIMRVLAGPQKNRLISDDEKRTIAAHEMGHAIVAHELPLSEPVHKVTIIGRGRALGLMVSLQEEDKHLRTKGELMSRMAVALGGRVAEEIMFDDITTGAANDLEKVNEIAQAMVLHYGMSDEFAPRSFVHEEHLVAHSTELKTKIDGAIDAFVNEAKLMAQEILLGKRKQMETLTELLIERETIDRDDFERLMRGEDALPEREDLRERREVRAAERATADAPGAGLMPTAASSSSKPDDSTDGDSNDDDGDGPVVERDLRAA